MIVCSSLARNLALLARDVHRTPAARRHWLSDGFLPVCRSSGRPQAPSLPLAEIAVSEVESGTGHMFSCFPEGLSVEVYCGIVCEGTCQRLFQEGRQKVWGGGVDGTIPFGSLSLFKHFFGSCGQRRSVSFGAHGSRA